MDIAARTGHKLCLTPILVFPACGRDPFLSRAVLRCCQAYWRCWPLREACICSDLDPSAHCSRA